MKKPEIYQQLAELTAGDYDVFVAALEQEGELSYPLYVVINRTTGVMEFNNENLNFITDWLNHFVKSKEQTGSAQLLDFPVPAQGN